MSRGFALRGYAASESVGKGFVFVFESAAADGLTIEMLDGTSAVFEGTVSGSTGSLTPAQWQLFWAGISDAQSNSSRAAVASIGSAITVDGLKSSSAQPEWSRCGQSWDKNSGNMFGGASACVKAGCILVFGKERCDAAGQSAAGNHPSNADCVDGVIAAGRIAGDCAYENLCLGGLPRTVDRRPSNPGCSGWQYATSPQPQVERHHGVVLSRDATKTISFGWTDASGVEAPADLRVQEGGRTLLEVFSAGDRPFARSGLDVVALAPNAQYRLELRREGGALEARIEDPVGAVAFVARARREPDAAEPPQSTVDLVLPPKQWRQAIRSRELD